MTNTPAPPYAVGQNTAAALTGRSLRTWQRRVEQGLVERLGEGRTLVPFAALLPELTVAIAPANLPLLVRADQGDAEAQAEMGALCALQVLATPAAVVAREQEGGERTGTAAALYFLQLAAEQGSADAMQWLAVLHASGAGRGEGDGSNGEALALMWLGRAAAQGHVLAREQLAGLVPGQMPRP